MKKMFKNAGFISGSAFAVVAVFFVLALVSGNNDVLVGIMAYVAAPMLSGTVLLLLGKLFLSIDVKFTVLECVILAFSIVLLFPCLMVAYKVVTGTYLNIIMI